MNEGDIESRKLSLAERQLEAEKQHRAAELELRREEIAQKTATEAKKRVWNTAPGLAVLGGVITLLTAIFSNFIQGCNTSRLRNQEHESQIALERQELQSQLIQKAIERADDNEAAAVNLDFLWNAGLIPDYDKIPGIVKESGKLPEETPTLPSRKTFGPGFGPFTGFDDRRLVNNTEALPYSAICSLTITSRTGRRYINTGFLVSPRVVVTSGHSIYMHGEGGFAQEVSVTPGRNGQEMPFGTLTATSFRVPSGWSDDQDNDYDYGAIILPSPLHKAGTLEILSMSDEELNSSTINVIGYPGDKPSGTLWGSSGEISAVSERRLGYDADTFGGMRGSPLVLLGDDVNKVLGVHTSSGSATRGIRFTTDVIQTINDWIGETEAVE